MSALFQQLQQGIIEAHLRVIAQYQDEMERRIVLLCKKLGMPQAVSLNMAHSISTDLETMLTSATVGEVEKVVNKAL